MVFLPIYAQDTLFGILPKANCFYSELQSIANRNHYMGVGAWCHGWGGSYAFSKYSQDTLTVYGIVANMGTIRTQYGPIAWKWDTMYVNYVLANGGDTTQVNSYEHLQLFEYTNDSLLTQIGDSLRVHVHDKPSYYLATEPEQVCYNYTPTMIFPMFERYFSTPQVVCDTFFVGRTCVMLSRYTTRDTFFNELNQVHTMEAGFLDKECYEENNFIVVAEQYHPTPTSTWKIPPPLYYLVPMIFPIVVPPEGYVADSTQNGDTVGMDTVGMHSPSVLERGVAVMPNPAQGQAKILSNYGILSAAAYNMAGMEVWRQKAGGNPVCRIDVSRWPAGEYVLRVETALGVVTKKLVVK